MTLFSEKNINNVEYKFYLGLDIDLILNQPNDLSKGFLVFFIESWGKEFNSYNRNLKIDYLLENKEYKEINSDEINKNCVLIYQTNGIGFEKIYNLVLNKIERTYNDSWNTVSYTKAGYINNIGVGN